MARRSRRALLGAGALAAVAAAAAIVTSVRSPAPDAGSSTSSPATASLASSAPRAVPVTTAGWPAPPASAVEVTVVRVIDGDTVALSGLGVGRSTQGGRSSRLIGIDTPEVFGGVECYGREASAFTRRELEGKRVLAGFDAGLTDRDARALVYVWTEDGVLFNARLVAEGYALPLTVPPNVRYADLFVRLARDARVSGRGLWSGCPIR